MSGTFFLQIFLQICIVLTGNYDFSNMLIVTLLLSLLDDQFFYGSKKSSNTKWNIIGKIVNILIHGALVFVIIHLYSIKLNGSQIESHIGKMILLSLVYIY